MEDFIKDYLSRSNVSSTYSEKNMVSNVRRLERLYDKPISEWNSYYDFEDTESLILNLNAKFSYNTSIATLHGLLCWLNYVGAPPKLIQSYRQYLNDYVEIRNLYNYDNVLTEQQRKNWLDFPLLKKKVLSLNEHYLGGQHAFTKFRNYLIISLYVLGLPVRLGNYLDVKYITEQHENPDTLPRTHNYICKGFDGKFTFIFNKYKTAKTIGQIIYKPENQILQRLITKWYANYSNNPSLFLTNTQGTSMSQTNLTNAITTTTQRLLNKEMTLNIIRQSFITDFMKKEKTIKERKKILKIIGQVYLPSTADLYVKI